jgi:2-amino-4-hydroxy-6-hydroxymethyldihydropteridine diphosphokinase
MQRLMVRAYIGLGGNLGDTLRHLRAASQALAQLPHSQLVQVSSLYQSAALNTDKAVVQLGSGGDYLNAVAALETALTAPALLQALQSIEQQAGRQRPHRNAPRTLDLDLLLYGSACIASPALQVPHPRMLQRAFVLQPLAEIAPHQVSAAQLQAVQDQRIERLGLAWGAPPIG